MKYRNIKKTVGIILLAFCSFSCLENEQPKYTQLTVLMDVTDEHLKNENFVSENLPKYMELMQLDPQTGGFSGGEVKLTFINEVSDSKSKTIKIEKGEPGLMGENPLTRKDEVMRFYKKLEEQLTAFSKTANWGTGSSKIYQKVARECIKMKRLDADRRCLIIYSDMLENSKLFNFYESGWKNKIEKMLDAPEVTIQQLSENGPSLPDLSEFEIYIVAKRTPANDEKINHSEEFWTAILEHQGATVYFGSELENF